MDKTRDNDKTQQPQQCRQRQDRTKKDKTQKDKVRPKRRDEQYFRPNTGKDKGVKDKTRHDIDKDKTSIKQEEDERQDIFKTKTNLQLHYGHYLPFVLCPLCRPPSLSR
jgi:hypothetical protein